MNHGFDVNREQQAQLVFAKEFFSIVDVHRDGTLNCEEILASLIGLGITTDQNFVNKVCPPQGLNIKQFLKLFRYDTIEKKIIQKLCFNI